jgi:regulator of Ty1 transposition protein 109
VSSNITRRVLSSLLTGHEFSTVERAVRGTETLERAIRGLCEGVNSNETDLPPPLDQSRRTPEPDDRHSWLAVPPQTPPRITNGKGDLPEVSPNPFPEPTASLETYNSWIYGTVCVDNPVLGLEIGGSRVTDGKEQKVTVLSVRKKKRKLD